MKINPAEVILLSGQGQRHSDYNNKTKQDWPEEDEPHEFRYSR
jgi:hypothetical protein